MSYLTKSEVFDIRIFGITQGEIAERCGLGRTYVSAIINGKRFSAQALVKIKTAIADIAKERRENIGHP